MEQIILDTNLKFVIKTLDLEEKGRLLTALLEENGEDLSKVSTGIYQYILSLQQEKAAKNRKMRELSALAAAARKRIKEAVTADLFTDDVPAVTDGAPAAAKRKEAKESNILNNKNKIKKIFSSSEIKNVKVKESVPLTVFVPPKADEVREFAVREGLNVHAETFVDFYESHGWCVGKTPIKNWQATARLWHRRYLQENNLAGNTETALSNKAEAAFAEKRVASPPAAPNQLFQNDETYWHELNERVLKREKTVGKGQGCLTSGVAMQTAGKAFEEEKKRTSGIAESPFARFMQRIEDNDILPEDKQ